MSRGNYIRYSSDDLIHLRFFFLIIFGTHIARNISFLGPLLESDIFRPLIGDTSFLLYLIRGGDGIVHVPRSLEISRLFHLYLIRRLYIFLLASIGNISFLKAHNELIFLGAEVSCPEMRFDPFLMAIKQDEQNAK